MRCCLSSCHQLGTYAHSGFYGSFQTEKLFDQYRAMPSNIHAHLLAVLTYHSLRSNVKSCIRTITFRFRLNLTSSSDGLLYFQLSCLSFCGIAATQVLGATHSVSSLIPRSPVLVINKDIQFLNLLCQTTGRLNLDYWELGRTPCKRSISLAIPIDLIVICYLQPCSFA